MPDLVLRGAKSGDFQFTLKSARCTDPGATFSPSEPMMDELTFEAMGDSLGDNKLTIDTASADFQFESEASQASTQSSEPVEGDGLDDESGAVVA